MELVFDTGKVWSFDELPSRSIAVDGAVLGPRIDNNREVYSFDHHGPVVRHATLSTCEQVLEALLVDFDPHGHTVYLNHIDSDSMLSLFLLSNPEAITRQHGAKLQRAVRSIGRIDALGPARGRKPTLMARLTPPGGLIQTVELVQQAQDGILQWLRDGTFDGLFSPPNASTRPPSTLVWINGGKAHNCCSRAGKSALYRRARFGIRATPAAANTMSFTVVKRSEFVRFDLLGFLAHMNALEPGWGGCSAAGGSPRRKDGTSSRFSIDEVSAELLAFSKGAEPSKS